MTVSNSSDFTQTRDQIIADALTTLGVYRPGATIATADYNICSNWLNKIMKYLELPGMHTWSEIEGTLFLRTGINKYTLSSSSSDQAGNDVIETTLSAAASASATTLTVTDSTGMTAADNIGILLDAGTRQWTTIVSVVSSTSITITAALTSAAAANNTVFTYTTAVSKPINVSSVRYRTSDGTDVPVFLRGRDEFMSIPSKTTQSSYVNQVFYSANRSDGTMYVWPTPDAATGRLKFSYSRMLYDFDSSSDNADVPTEWLKCITLLLMADVAPVYGKPESTITRVRQEADRCLLEMNLLDLNNGSIRIVPDYRED